MKFLIIAFLFSIHINEYLTQNGRLLFYRNELNDNGYKFRFKTLNMGRSETASFDSTKPDNVLLKVTGSYFYYGTDGRLLRIQYTADENGYHPKITIATISSVRLQDHPKIITGTRPSIPIEPYSAPVALLYSLGGQGLG